MLVRPPIALAILTVTLLSCAAERQLRTRDPEPASPPPLDEQAIPKSQIALPALVQSLPPNASREQVEAAVARILPEVYASTVADAQQVLVTAVALGRQPHAVAAMVDEYRKIPAPDYERRLKALELVGEMQRPDAMPFLLEIIWMPLPAADPLEEGLSPRELEEILRVKATHGLAYLGTPDSDKAILDIVGRHESLAVRIAAIDAYMWTSGDSAETAGELYRALPAELHPCVRRPRFHRAMDRERFSADLEAWRKRWGDLESGR